MHIHVAQMLLGSKQVESYYLWDVLLLNFEVSMYTLIAQAEHEFVMLKCTLIAQAEKEFVCWSIPLRLFSVLFSNWRRYMPGPLENFLDYDRLKLGYAFSTTRRGISLFRISEMHVWLLSQLINIVWWVPIIFIFEHIHFFQMIRTWEKSRAAETNWRHIDWN